MSKKRDMQRIIRAWKDETKATAIDMDKVALHAAGKGWPLPSSGFSGSSLIHFPSGGAGRGSQWDGGIPGRVLHHVSFFQ